MRNLWYRLIFLVLLSLAASGAARASERVALVIGNSQYAAAPYLPNPTNDARTISEALTAAGFEVELHTDVEQAQLIRLLGAFQRKAAVADTAVIYYAGHGMEINRQNYLIPVDAQLEFASDAAFQAVTLDLVTRAVQDAGRLGLVIIDACRNNPFAVRLDQADANRAVRQGMARVEPHGNILVALAAREGTVALDGIGENSPYALSLARALRTPGLEIGKLFRIVRDEVMAATGGAQEPVLYGTFSAEDYYFLAAAAPPAAEAPPPLPATPDADAVALQIEMTFWESVERSDSAEEYAAYLERYPDGVFAALARARLERLAPRTPAPETGTEVAVPRVEPEVSTPPAAPEEPPQDVPVAALVEAPAAPEAAPAGEMVRAAVAPEAAVDAAGSIVALPTPSGDGPPAPADGTVSGPDVVRLIQTELERLGCAPGAADGIWGPASRRSLDRLRSTGQLPDQAGDQPDGPLLAALGTLPAGICPQDCGPGQVLSGGTCITRTCPAGQRLSSKGVCYVPKPAASVSKATPRTGSGAGCVVFNGKRVC